MKKLFLFLVISCISLLSFAQGPITGTFDVCVGSSTTLACTPPGGTWASSNSSTATIGTSSGTVTGISAGVVTITYFVIGTFVTQTFTVNPVPTISASVAFVCTGNTITLSASIPGGTWSSSATSVATIDPSTGVITGVAAGSTVITYMLPTGCFGTTVVFVNTSPGAITGPNNVCVGSTIILTGTGGGTWSSGTIAVATVGSSTGVVTGVSAGTAVITYMLPSGCFVTTTITVNPLPGPIIGSAGTPGGITLCVGSSTTLFNAVPGGTWSSGTTAVATIGSVSGIITGVSAGTSTITYMLPTGCYTTAVVTVTPTPGAITGPGSACVGSTIILTGTGGGTWSSGTTTVATIGSVSGIVTGVGAGVSVITYMLPSGCFVTTTVTVNPIPGPIGSSTGLRLCVGGSMTLTNLVTGGTWSSGTTAVATIGSLSGVITGVSPGTSTITYTLPTGCFTTAVITINATPGAITGPNSVCVGSTIVLTGTGGGTWSASPAAIATIGSSSGIVTGVTAGVATVTYMLPSGCFVTTTVTVNPIPGPITFSGTTGIHLCAGSSITLTNTVPGGTWSSSTPAVATIGSLSGVLTGVSAGTSVITYMLPTGCYATAIVTVTPMPGVITGPGSVCVGSTIVLTGTGGGTWSSGTTTVATIGSASGVVTGVGAGTTVITYMIPSTGCFVTTIVTVNPIPAPITGSAVGSTLCVGGTLTLSSATPGGTWSSGTPAVATVGSLTGVVTGVSPGVTTITYTLPTGCSVSITVVVVASPGPITGTLTVCVGGTTALSCLPSGGTWSSGTVSVATVGSATGFVTGVSPGTSVITYTLPSGCSVSVTVTVNVGAGPISGPGSVCAGSTITLTAPGSGAWSSGTPTVATVGVSSGVVTGVASGVTIITYMISTGCLATASVTVNPLPAPIAGPTSACVGSTVVFTNTSPGGTWSSSNTSVATIGSVTGIATAVSAGSTIIIYTLPTGCSITASLIVNPNPGPITGPGSVCVGSSIPLSCPGGGTWSSGNTTVATVVATSGIVWGVTAGTAVITYTLPTGCISTTTITVNPVPLPITGPTAVCVGLSITLSNATPGGTWSSGNPAIATVGSTSGVVTGVSAGAVTIMYILPTGCSVSFKVIVNPLPCTNGVNETPADNNIAVYPNPANDELIVKADLGAHGSYVITNQVGQVMTQAPLKSPKTSVDIHMLPSGLYYITVKGDNTSKVLRFVKM